MDSNYKNLNNTNINRKILTYDKNIKIDESPANDESETTIESVYDSVNNEEIVIISKILLRK
jgi:hypothetical protein